VAVLTVLHEGSAADRSKEGNEELANIHRDAVNLLGYTLQLHRQNVAFQDLNDAMVGESSILAASDSTTVAGKLASLLPHLEFSRKTHVQWRDCDQSWRDMNPSIGDSKFHDDCVKEYDNRIHFIREAVTFLSTTQRIGGTGNGSVVYSVALKWLAQLVELSEPEVVVSQLRNPPFPDGVLNRQSVMRIIARMREEMEAALASPSCGTAVDHE
jgi:hypothetical protein